ncbi:MmgE/PrpD family protein [Ureibacillus composti]
MKDVISYSLARLAKRISYQSLDTDTILEVKRRVLDTFGCLIAGFDSHASKVLREFAIQYPSDNGATLIGKGIKIIPEYATLANGGAIRYLDFNDTYLSKEPLHPSDVIAPLLALQEQYDIPIERLITAIAISYQVGVMLCDNASLKSNGWDHVNYITISTVVGAAHLLDLNEEQTVNAIALAIVPHAAMRQTRNGEISEWKGVAAANAAKNAVFAVKLALTGMQGPYEAIQGSMGMNPQLLKNSLNIEELAKKIDGILTPTAITKTYVKNWAVEYMTQSAIEAALIARKKINSMDEIRKIELETFQLAFDVLAKDAQKWAPKTRETADHSLPYIVMAALEDGEITIETFNDERIKNQQTLERIKKLINISVTEEMQAGYPAGNPNRVKLLLKDGSTVIETIIKPLGHSSNPMTTEQVIDKFKRITAGTLTTVQQKNVIDLTLQLEKCESLQEIYKEMLL